MPKVAMISGASRGIGLAIARELADAGYVLSLGLRAPDRTPAALAHVPEDRLLRHRYESTDRKAATPWVDATMMRFGRIDALVNCAGISHPAITIENGSNAALDEMFEINLFAPFRLVQAAFPHLKASGAGRVVNVASLSGKRVVNPNVGYHMTKHALVALTHSIRREGWDAGVRATALCPGFVATDMSARVVEPPLDKMTQPSDLAKLVRTVIELPNTASVAEVLVNWRYEALW